MLDLDFIFGNAPWPVAVTTTPNPAMPQDELTVILTAPDLQPQDSNAAELGESSLESTIRCPWCESRRLLEDGDTLRCADCQRVAWETTSDGWFVRSDCANQEIIDVPAPCPTCGGIVFWWDLAGDAHCEACSPRTRAMLLRARAQLLRERRPVMRDPDLQPQILSPRMRPATPVAVEWPAAAADFCLLLTPDDLPPFPFRLNPWTVVQNASNFLRWLQADTRRGPSGPRAFYGALQRDLQDLQWFALEAADKR